MGKQRASGKQSLPKHNPKLESLEQRQLYASDLGINVNSVNAGNYKAIVETLVASHTKGVRLWYGFGDYSNRTLLPVTTYAQKFHNDGFEVTLSVNPSKGRTGTADDTRGLFEFLATQPELKNSVDIWELGNEPDSQKYWRGNLDSFVTDFVAPAARVLHNQGEIVASGGVSWNPKDVKTMVDAGLLNSVDYVGIHPYTRSIGALKNTIAELKSYVGGTPLIATEWNFRGHETDGNTTAWADGIAAMWPIIRENFAVSHYFVSTVMDSLAGPAGILNVDGSANNPFYNTYMALQNDLPETDSTEIGSDPTGSDPTDDSTTTDPDSGDSHSGGSTTPAPSTSTDGEDDASSGSGSKGSSSSNSKSGGGTNSSTDGETDSSGSDTGSKASDSPTKSTTRTPTRSGGRGVKSSKPSTSAQSTPTPVAKPVVVPPPVIVTPPVITSLSILNTTRDRVVKPYAVLSGVNTIDLAATGTAYLSLLASTNKKVGSVVWTINGNTVVDSDGTFTLFGEKNGDLLGTAFEAGRNYVLTVQAFSGAGGTGMAGTLATISIDVVDSANPGAGIGAQERADQAARARRIARESRINNPVVIPGL